MNVETLTIPVERKCSMSVVRGSLFPIRARLKKRIKIWTLFYSDRFGVSGSGFNAFHILTWQTFHREIRNCRIHSLGETVLLFIYDPFTTGASNRSNLGIFAILSHHCTPVKFLIFLCPPITGLDSWSSLTIDEPISSLDMGSGNRECLSRPDCR